MPLLIAKWKQVPKYQLLVDRIATKGKGLDK